MPYNRLQAWLEEKRSVESTPFPARSFRCALSRAGGCRVVMGHLGIGLLPSLATFPLGRWHPSHLKFGMIRPQWREDNKRDGSSSIGLPYRLVAVSSDVASSRRKTSVWTLIPVKIFFGRGCAACGDSRRSCTF